MSDEGRAQAGGPTVLEYQRLDAHYGVDAWHVIGLSCAVATVACFGGLVWQLAYLVTSPRDGWLLLWTVGLTLLGGVVGLAGAGAGMNERPTRGWFHSLTSIAWVANHVFAMVHLIIAAFAITISALNGMARIFGW